MSRRNLAATACNVLTYCLLLACLDHIDLTLAHPLAIPSNQPCCLPGMSRSSLLPSLLPEAFSAAAADSCLQASWARMQQGRSWRERSSAACPHPEENQIRIHLDIMPSATSCRMGQPLRQHHDSPLRGCAAMQLPGIAKEFLELACRALKRICPT